MGYDYKNKNRNNQKPGFFRVNERIRFSPVLVIDQEGQNLGAISTEKALMKAKAAGLDLVEVSPTSRPPVCRIMDFGKFRYEQSQKEKKQKQKSKVQALKEVRLSPRIADHDIEVKTNIAKKFLEHGHKVQLRLEFKKRENAHKDLGFEVMNKVISLLENAGCTKTKPNLDGKTLTCLIEPKDQTK